MSHVTAKKSLNISSAIGRRPVIAAPMAAPTIACSLIGVSRTRSGPNLSNRPSVSLKTPPAAPTSSPTRTTDSSRVISCAIPAAIAPRYVISGISSPRLERRLAAPIDCAARPAAPRRPAVRPDLGLDHVRRRLRGGSCLCFGRGDRRLRLLVDRVQGRLIHTGLDEPGTERRDGVARLPGGDLVVRPVLAWI